jgi:N-methylhydantoinase A/oxoprolinase/acetone carboxylase beta subunit
MTANGATPLRIGVDVGGTFTKAVAVSPGDLEVRARGVVPTSHRAPGGVAEGVAGALREVMRELGDRRGDVELVAFATTQAMNALLEGDVARVGVVGIGADPELRPARRRTRVGSVALAPGRVLETEHVFLDATRGLRDADVDAALERLVTAGCESLAVSGAFAVDAPEHEEAVARRARALGLPVCMGHELTGTYGLETRTITAAVNASILPVVARTAAFVEQALADAGVDARLLVLRGDGGAMSVEAFRRAPTFTIGSGPAAGVAATLHELDVRDGVVLECGGTSSNVSVVRRGRTVVRSLKVMGRPTAIRAIDSWVVGAAGGSMAAIGRRRVEEVGPRSAHVAGLPYACFADPGDLVGAELELVAPREGDPAVYATVRAGGCRYALTATCAANALGLAPEGSYAAGSREAALAAFTPLGACLRRSAQEAARAVVDRAVEKVVDAVREAVREHDVPEGAPIVAIGGAGEALAGEVARRVGRRMVSPRHAEVLSSVGSALSLVGAEVARSSKEGLEALEVAAEAERACIDSGAAPASVSVETRFEPREGVVRAVATGAVALEAGAASREAVDEPSQLRAAAETLRIDAGDLHLVATTDFYRVYSENGSGRTAVVDHRGAVPLAENARRVVAGSGDGLIPALDRAVSDATVNLGVATMAPQVALICGSRILDMSNARRPADILAAARRALGDHEGPAVAVVWR